MTSQSELPVLVTEGSTTITFTSANEVFYNPVQQYNRDLSTLGIRAWSDGFLSATEEKVGKRHTNRKLCDAKPEACESKGISGPQKDCDGERNFVVHKSEGEKEADIVRPSNQKQFSILEALSATGLRAIRYAKEISNVSQITANDLSASAVRQIRYNSEYNKTTDKVIPHQGDARALMYTNQQKWDVIDLDPYGSAAPFIDAAVQAAKDGGLLLITCTDLAVLAGDSYPEKCFSQYGGTSLKISEFCHEQALRMVLHTIMTSAARYGRSVRPLLSLSIDFYVRIFVTIETSPLKVKRCMSNTMLTFECSGCKAYINQPLGYIRAGKQEGTIKYGNASLKSSSACDECGFPYSIGGPMYAGPIHDADFVERVIKLAKVADPKIYGTLDRIEGMLTLAQEELKNPHYWSINRMAKILHCQSPPQRLVASALLNAGFHVSGTHARTGCIKTDAPPAFMWDIMRDWVRLFEVHEAQSNYSR